MKKYRKKIPFFILFLILLIAFTYLWKSDLVNFESLQEDEEGLFRFIETHYSLSVGVFILIYMTTAFVIPAALILATAGGFLFGLLPGVLFINIGATLGGTLAFLCARHLFGDWIQRKYGGHLKAFNEEIARHGIYYLFSLRMIPVLPFFVVNYLTGITKISLRKYILATSLGELPGSFVYCFAGRELGMIQSQEDIWSPKIILAFGLLIVFALLPVFLSLARKLKRRS